VDSESASGAAQAAQQSGPLRVLARLGFAANGLLHLLIAGIAIAIALGAGRDSADQSGALSQIAATPGGLFVLWVVVVGLSALGLWLALGAFLLTGPDPKRVWTHRLVEISKAVVYLALAVTAAVFAAGGSTSSSGSAQDASATLLTAPGGVILLLAGGVVLLGIGAYFVRKGALKKFTSDLAVPTGPTGRAIVALGIVGYIAKGIVLGVVAILIVLAALTVDPSKSTGLDGALKALAALPFGGLILGGIGVGLVMYGLYCFARAWRARL
jgi:hypothetical protein